VDDGNHFFLNISSWVFLVWEGVGILILHNTFTCTHAYLVLDIWIPIEACGKVPLLLMCVCVCVCACIIFVYVYIVAGVCTLVLLLVGHCLTTKVFIGKLPDTRGAWVIIG
jgi:hypothetical protein